MSDHSYKKPGMTLWESLGLNIPANAPGGARMLPPSTYNGTGSKRVTHGEDRDANHHPGYEEN